MLLIINGKYTNFYGLFDERDQERLSSLYRQSAASHFRVESYTSYLNALLQPSISYMHMIILLRNKSLDRTINTHISQYEADDNPYQALSLEYDSDTDTELKYPSQYLLLQYDLQTSIQVIVQILLLS